MIGAPTVKAPPAKVLRRIVGLASRAPSVHNTQPWRWRAHSGVLELHADHTRQLRAGDPEGRNLVISCGAALHHAQVAAQALGWASQVERVPYGAASTLLARLAFTRTAVPAGSAEQLEAIERRCTDRRRFTSWPVPEDRLAHLAGRASAWGVRALPLLDVADRFRAELLEHRAFERQRDDEQIALELHDWVEHEAPEGIPSSVRPGSDAGEAQRPSRFPAGVLEESEGREVEGSDGLIVLCGPDDTPLAWLQAGEGLSALWLAATVEGLSVVPLSQVVEVPETRDALQREVLGGLAHPLILVRVGWQAISRSELPRTPRRPVDDIFDGS
jgi:nitroreductase